MSNHAAATAEYEQPGVDPVYLTRDDLARSLNPINDLERMLVTAAAQAWHALQNARELEAQVFAQTRPLDLFSTRLEHFKTITRHVANADRAWRQAMAAFDRAKRNRAPRPILRPRTTPPPTFDSNPTPASPASQNKPNATPARTNPDPTAPKLQNKPNPTPAPTTPQIQNEPNPATTGRKGYN